MTDTPEQIQRDIAAVQRIGAVPALLKIVCANTGMGYAAVARVTEGNWTACAVQDDIAFGLEAGGQLDVRTTLCFEAREARSTVVFDQASVDPKYCDHHTPRIYNIESYISVPIVRPNGSYFGNLCAIDPEPRAISDPKTIGMFESFAELIGSLLEQQERLRETEDALLDAKETAELREQFMAVLGHDLRNPLAAIQALGELFARRKDEPELAKAGARIRTTTRRMGKLIDDLMDFTRARMGSGLQLALASASDLSSALANVVDEERAAHPGQQIDAVLHIAAPVHCDSNRIQQLLSNLIGNALTHGAADRPVLVAAGIENENFVLSVRNWGEPISPAAIAKIFEPYWRPADSKAKGGLGLGLHICSKIVEAHGGTLSVSSDAESGTCFLVVIPLARDVRAG